MRIGAYQFRVTGDAEQNALRITEGTEKAAEAGAGLLVFPECAVTGYPPRCVRHPSDIDFDAVDRIHGRLQELAGKHRMHLVAGTILREADRYCNAAVAFSPDGTRTVYRKRALWGWDRKNFSEGRDPGVPTAGPLKTGIRICYEVRFPEYFRELYRERTDLNLVLFHDVSDREDPERMELIRAHLRTRAAENVCCTLSCNTASPYQTAPTELFDRSGRTLAAAEPGTEGLLVYDLEKTELNFGESGRKAFSDLLTGTPQSEKRL